MIVYCFVMETVKNLVLYNLLPRLKGESTQSQPEVFLVNVFFLVVLHS
jgi:hypothetical protein